MSQEGVKSIEAQPHHATQFISAHPDSLSSHEKHNIPRALPKTAILLGLGREHALSGQRLTKDHLEGVSAKKIDVEAVYKLSQELRTEGFNREKIINADKGAFDEYNIDLLGEKVTDVDIWTAITAYQIQQESDAAEYTQALADFGIKDFSDKDALRQQVDAFWEKYLNIEGENHGDPDKFTDDFIRLHSSDASQALDALSPLLSAWGDATMIQDMIMLKAGVSVGKDESVLTHEVADTYHPRLLKIQKHLEEAKNGSEKRESIDRFDVPVKQEAGTEVNQALSLPAIARAAEVFLIPAAGETVTSPETPLQWKEYLGITEADLMIFKNIEALRMELEVSTEADPALGWKKVKELARQEIVDLYPDALQQLYEAFSPYIEELPSGHGKGHFSRDLVNITALLKSKSLVDESGNTIQPDDVELLVGVFGGLFHDIGNSVVNRYDDAKRFATHSEVGAYLFGNIAKDILPSNLTKLVEYSIAAHTHYVNDFPVRKGDQEVMKKSYVGHDAVIIDGQETHKAGIWLTRQTDRQDLLQDLPIWIRHMETKTLPTQDFSGEGFHEPLSSEIEDFQFHFSTYPRIQVKLDKDGKEVSQTPNVMLHILRLSNSAFAKNVYTSTDSEEFTSLAEEGRKGTLGMIEVLSGQHSLTNLDQIEQSFNRFYQACQIIDPGKDMPSVLEQFRAKYSTLSIEDRGKWANGFNYLTGDMWKNWYARTQSHIQGELPKLSSDPKVQAILTDVQRRAQNVVTAFNPDLLNISQDQIPNAVTLMKS